MTWSAKTLYGIQLPGPAIFGGSPLQAKDMVEYLRVSLGPKGVTAHRLIERVNSAIKMLQTIMRIKKRCRTTLCQQRAIVKTFKYSVTDYVLYLQQRNDRRVTRAADMELMCLRFITGLNVKPRGMNRVMRLTGMLPIRALKRLHLIKSVTKFCNRARGDDETTQAEQNWDAMSR